jgi:hypothetical protein
VTQDARADEITPDKDFGGVMNTIVSWAVLVEKVNTR